MDRALLERMVGAVALVLLLVIVAPALLDGTSERPASRFASDPDEDVRTQVIVLNEPRSTEVPDEAPATEPVAEVIAPERDPEPRRQAEKSAPAASDSPAVRDPSEATPAAPVPDTSETPEPSLSRTDAKASLASVNEAPAVVTAAATKTAPEPSQSAVAAPSASKASAEFAVQLGSFGQLENARKFAAEIGARGFAVFVRSSASGSGGVHRVYAGPRPDRDAAAKLAVVLGDAGYKGIVVDLSGNASNGGR